MTNDKRQPDEERQSQRTSYEPINLKEYAGDAEDNQLTCEQVNEYLKDLDRSQRVHQERRVDNTSDDQ
jgi:hypothetical protein